MIVLLPAGMFEFSEHLLARAGGCVNDQVCLMEGRERGTPVFADLNLASSHTFSLTSGASPGAVLVLELIVFLTLTAGSDPSS